jgi:hypothetical protein
VAPRKNTHIDTHAGGATFEWQRCCGEGETGSSSLGARERESLLGELRERERERESLISDREQLRERDTDRGKQTHPHTHTDGSRAREKERERRNVGETEPSRVGGRERYWERGGGKGVREGSGGMGSPRSIAALSRNFREEGRSGGGGGGVERERQTESERQTYERSSVGGGGEGG